ncbi:MAG: hypothetical protein AAF609_17525 [Cyanobacteria bacterium P01_C01_bin.120]
MEQGVAFLVGVDEYQDQHLLDFSGDKIPSQDVRDLLDILETKNSLYRPHPEFTLLDQPITIEELDEQLEKVLSPNSQFEDVLIYFSGHGYQTLEGKTKKSKIPKGYLGTHDAEITFDRDGKPDGERNGLSFERLGELIEEATHLKSLVLWIDACHSGFAIDDALLRSALGALPRDCAYSILASAHRSEAAYSGVFTNAIMERLSQQESGPINAADIAAHVISKLEGQRPVDVSSKDNLICLMDYPPKAGGQLSEVQTLEPVRDPNGALVSPYRGLKAFEDDEQQQAFFFGRDQDILKIRNRLDQSVFVPVIGASGSGKSSVVKAGLVRKQLRQKEASDWCILPIMKPGETPLKSLKRAFGGLLQFLEDGSKAYQAMDDFVYGGESLTVEAFQVVLQQLGTDKQYLLVIDQFEETFTLTGAASQVADETETTQRIEKRDRFLELVTSVAQIEQSPLKVVVTMRVDFLGQCLTHPALKNLIEQEAVYIAPLVGTGLIDAIEQPALRQGYPIDPGLRDALLRDVKSEPGFLPLLEFTLDQLWQRREKSPHPCIPQQAYEKLGAELTGAEGGAQSTAKQTVSGLRQALNLHANEVFEHSYQFENPPRKERSSSEAQQEQAWIRLIFLKLLRTGEGNTDTRDPQSRASLLQILADENDEHRQRLEKVIDSLINGRLLVSDEGRTTDEQVIDLAHEALIDGWGKYQEWRAEDREIRRLAERLEDARRDWDNAPDQDKKGFLINRALLAQVRESWSRLKFFLPDPQAGWTFYLQSDRAEKAENLELQLLVQAPQVSRQIEAKRPPAEILTTAIRMVGIDREFFPERFIGSVPASLRQVVENIYTSRSYGHDGSVNAVAFSPDGQAIVSGSEDGTVRLWNLDGTPQGTPFQGHGNSVFAVAFSPDGQTIVSGSFDKTVRLWNLDGTPQGTPFQGHGDAVFAVAFSPDGQTIVSGSRDKTVRLWNGVGWRSWLQACLYRLGNCWIYDKDGLACRTRLFEEGYIAVDQGDIKLAQVKLSQALQSGTADFIDSSLTDEELKGSVNQIIEPVLIRQAHQAAQQGRVSEAVTRFKQAKQLNPKLALEPEVEAQRLAAPIYKMQGTLTALSLEIDTAIAKYVQAKEYDPTLELEPEVEAKRLAAPILINQGEELAEALELEAAIAKYVQAKEYDPTLELEPEVEAKRLAAPILINQGEELAEVLELEAAIAKYVQAREYDPTLELEPGSEAKRLVAERLIEKGKELVTQGSVQEALTSYQSALALTPELEISPDDWSMLCVHGALHSALQKNTKQIKTLLAAGETVLNEHLDDPYSRVTLGLVRALTGTKKRRVQAIKDFQFYVQNSDDDINTKNMVQRWLDSLVRDENPFSETELKELLEQMQ